MRINVGLSLVAMFRYIRFLKITHTADILAIENKRVKETRYTMSETNYEIM